MAHESHRVMYMYNQATASVFTIPSTKSKAAMNGALLITTKLELQANKQHAWRRPIAQAKGCAKYRTTIRYMRCVATQRAVPPAGARARRIVAESAMGW